MELDYIIGSTASLNIPFDASEQEEENLNLLFQDLRIMLWGKDTFFEQLKSLKSERYGNDLRLILFQFEVFPNKGVRENYKYVETFRQKEKSIGINIFVDNENYFDKDMNGRVSFLKQAIYDGLSELGGIVKKKKLDTDMDQLQRDVRAILDK